MQKITPFLWFEKDAEEAVKFYASTFKNTKINGINQIAPGVITGSINLEGQEFMVLQGGPTSFKFNDSISMFVNCEDQAEVDYLWDRLTADGGQESRCGWLKDKYGLFWQIIPKALGQLMGDKNPVKAGNVMQAMMKMNKIIVADLQSAYDKE